MPSSMAIALSTRGHVCKEPDAVIVVSDLVPGLRASSLEPSINTEGQKPPGFELLSVEPVPEVSAKSPSTPLFDVRPVVDQVPGANTKKDSKIPEAKIRPVEGLVPIILNKGD